MTLFFSIKIGLCTRQLAAFDVLVRLQSGIPSCYLCAFLFHLSEKGFLPKIYCGFHVSKFMASLVMLIRNVGNLLHLINSLPFDCSRRAVPQEYPNQMSFECIWFVVWLYIINKYLFRKNKIKKYLFYVWGSLFLGFFFFNIGNIFSLPIIIIIYYLIINLWE